MATKNHNIRFNLSKEEEQRAWELLHSKEVEQRFKSKNSFVLQAINYYYDRCLAITDDPYLETREKEDAFINRIAENVEQKVLANIPALAGVYLMQQQSLLSASMQSGITPMMPFVNTQMQGSTQATGSNDSSQSVGDKLAENMEEEDVEKNEYLDVDMF